MITASAQTIEFLTKEADFAFNLYQAAELEVRATERYVLVGLAAMYSYLAATKDIPFRKYAWHAPTFVVVFAGIRALGLGYRQWGVVHYLQTVEAKVLCADASLGWAKFKQWPIVTLSAVLFYVLLLTFTIFIANRMTNRERINPTT